MTGEGHVVVAPDKFKGSLTAGQVARHVAAGLRRALPGIDVREAPVADGGDGTVEAVVARGYELVSAVVSGPTGLPVAAAFGRHGRRAVIELSEASGLRRLPDARLDAVNASSRGTGELVRAALDAGCDEIVIGVGGSACTDGGAGMLQALGVRVLDGQGRELGPGGAALEGVVRVDPAGLDPRIRQARVVLASDVDNPLLGTAGAAAVYGPQKGAAVEQVAVLDANLHRWADAVAKATGSDASGQPGAGAAGGVGFAALAVLGAEMRPGIEVVLGLIGFEELLPGARLAITGEGSLDLQSLHGKAPVGVASAARKHGLQTIAVAGRCVLSAAELRSGGLSAAYALTGLEPDPRICMREAGRLLEELAAAVIAPRWLSGRVNRPPFPHRRSRSS